MKPRLVTHRLVVESIREFARKHGLTESTVGQVRVWRAAPEQDSKQASRMRQARAALPVARLRRTG